jgi:hypothetical protein
MNFVKNILFLKNENQFKLFSRIFFIVSRGKRIIYTHFVKFLDISYTLEV